MISTVTTTTTDISVYFLLFVVLIGFAYHLIRNKEYKKQRIQRHFTCKCYYRAYFWFDISSCR